MKANELMIGDWVMDGKNIAQITSITCDGIIETTFNESSNIEVIEPIPLTTEILEKNGYHTTPIYDIDDDSIVYQHIDLYGEWTWYNGKIYYSITDEEVVEMFDCKYVHELQHFLSLRGIEKEIIL